MTGIQDDLKSFKESVKFKEQRRLQAESAREYKVCEKLPSPFSLTESEATRRSSVGEQTSLHKFCTQDTSDSNTEPTSSCRSSLNLHHLNRHLCLDLK